MSGLSVDIFHNVVGASGAFSIARGDVNFIVKFSTVEETPSATSSVFILKDSKSKFNSEKARTGVVSLVFSVIGGTENLLIIHAGEREFMTVLPSQVYERLREFIQSKRSASAAFGARRK